MNEADAIRIGLAHLTIPIKDAQGNVIAGALRFLTVDQNGDPVPPGSTGGGTTPPPVDLTGYARLADPNTWTGFQRFPGGIDAQTIGGVPVGYFARTDITNTFAALQHAQAGMEVVGGLTVDTINGHPISDFLAGGTVTPPDLTPYARLDANQAWAALQVFALGIDAPSISGIPIDRFARRDEVNVFTQAMTITADLVVDTLNGHPISDFLGGGGGGGGTVTPPDLTGYARLNAEQDWSGIQTFADGINTAEISGVPFDRFARRDQANDFQQAVSIANGLTVDTINGHPISDFLAGSTPPDLTGYARLDAINDWSVEQIFTDGIRAGHANINVINSVPFEKFALRDAVNAFTQAMSITGGLTVDTINGHPISDFLDAGAAPDGVVLQDGTRPLTADWNIGLGRRIKAQYIDAIDATGLSIGDHQGNLALFVKVGGYIGIRNNNPQAALHVTGSFYLDGNQTVSGAAGVTVIGNGSVSVGNQNNGAGGRGGWLGAGRNLTDGAPGHIALGEGDGGNCFVWADDSGNLRFASASSIGWPTAANRNTLGARVATLGTNVFTAVQRIDTSGGALMLAAAVPAQHVYLAFYPDSFANGRKAYVGFGANTSKVLSIINEWNDPAAAINIQTVGNNLPIQFSVNSAERARVTNNGLGISGGGAPFNPQGPLHVYDGTGGFAFITKAGIAGAEVVLLPAANGPHKGMQVSGILVPSSGSISDIFPVPKERPASAYSYVEIKPASGTTYTFQIRLYSTGEVRVVRTAGTVTGTIAIMIVWV